MGKDGHIQVADITSTAGPVTLAGTGENLMFVPIMPDPYPGVNPWSMPPTSTAWPTLAPLTGYTSQEDPI